MEDPAVISAGIVVVDIFPPVLPHLPGAGELLQVDQIDLHLGGCATNCAVDLARLGVRAAVSGRIGRDPFADLVLRLLREDRVDTSLLRFDDQAPTSRTMMLPVAGEDRRFIHAFGANAHYGPADVDYDAVARSRLLYMGGWFGLPSFPPDALRELFAHARRSGVTTVLDVIVPSDAPHAAWMASLTEILPLTDWFLPNTDEARLLTGETEPDRQAARFIEVGAGTVAITLGAQGSVVRTRQERLRAGVFPIDYLDGTGSGDAFDAGVMLGILEGWGLARTVTFASALAASAVRAIGTTTGVFTRTEAEAFIASYRLSLE